MLQGPWCSRCGQKRVRLDPTWRDLLRDGVHELLDVDGTFLSTVRKLFLQPGELTAEFLRGRRARYTSPLRIYLTFSALFFLLTAIVPNPNPDREAGVAAPTAGELAFEGHVESTLSSLTPKLVFMLVPVFALLLKMAHRRQPRRYPQFLYFSLHLHAAVFAGLALTVPLQALPSEVWLKAAQATVLACGFGYLVLGVKRVFGGTTPDILVRALAVSVGYLAVLAAAGIFIILVLTRRAGAL